MVRRLMAFGDFELTLHDLRSSWPVGRGLPQPCNRALGIDIWLGGQIVNFQNRYIDFVLDIGLSC